MYGEISAPLLHQLSQTVIPLPHHRDGYHNPTLARIADGVLEEAGLSQSDLKARILTKAYMSRGSRNLIVIPTDVAVLGTGADDLHAGKYRLPVSFTLQRGSYATLVLSRVAQLTVTSNTDCLEGTCGADVATARSTHEHTSPKA
jgi:tRNA(Glu) U13 pseudouridine synthase TruD